MITTQPVKGVSPKYKVIGKVVDQGKGKGKHIQQDSGADEVSKILVKANIKEVDM